MRRFNLDYFRLLSIFGWRQGDIPSHAPNGILAIWKHQILVVATIPPTA
jgi:hypothetical protein